MFDERYAERRTDVNEGHLEALARLCEWLEDGQPFCHIRFSDGELNPIAETPGPGWDGNRSVSVELRDGLRVVLHTIADQHPDHGRLLVGGDWSGDQRHRQYLAERDLLRRIPWVPSSVFVDGVMSGAVLRWLQGLRTYPGQVVLVGCGGIRTAAAFMHATFIEVPGVDAWLSTDSTLAWIRAQLPTDRRALVIFCAGQSSKAWAWEIWTGSNRTVSVVDMGHFFDLACGMKTRMWHEETRPPWSLRREVYEAQCTPIILRVA